MDTAAADAALAVRLRSGLSLGLGLGVGDRVGVAAGAGVVVIAAGTTLIAGAFAEALSLPQADSVTANGKRKDIDRLTLITRTPRRGVHYPRRVVKIA